MRLHYAGDNHGSPWRSDLDKVHEGHPFRVLSIDVVSTADFCYA